MAENNKSMDKGRKLLIGFIIVLLLLTAGAYFFGVYYFTEHFLPGSQVNGFNCSYMTEKEAENLLEQKTGVYALAVQTRGNGQEAITADEIQLKYKLYKMLRIWFKFKSMSSYGYDDEFINLGRMKRNKLRDLLLFIGIKVS